MEGLKESNFDFVEHIVAALRSILISGLTSLIVRPYVRAGNRLAVACEGPHRYPNTHYNYPSEGLGGSWPRGTFFAQSDKVTFSPHPAEPATVPSPLRNKPFLFLFIWFSLNSGRNSPERETASGPITIRLPVGRTAPHGKRKLKSRPPPRRTSLYLSRRK